MGQFRDDATVGGVIAGIRRGELPSPSQSDKPKRVLRTEEISKLLAATATTYTPIVTLLAWSGLRVSESIALRWCDIDFVDGMCRVEGQLPALKRRERPRMVNPKSKRGLREVPFLPAVTAALERHLGSELAAGRGQADDFVFATRTGRP